MALGEDFDSGMESQEGSARGSASGSAKDNTPDKKPAIESGYDDEVLTPIIQKQNAPDETFGERLVGLTEMFPELLRTVACSAAENTSAGIKNFYNFSRSAFWVVFSSSIILFAPVIFEVERAQLEEMQRNQQKQILLGPNTAVSSGGLPLMPPLTR